MDRRTLRERKRRKQAQLRRRKMIRLGVYAAALVLAVVFLIRGIILPLLGGSDLTETGEVPVVKEEVADPDAAVRQPLKGADDLARLKTRTPGWHEDEAGRWYQNPDGTYFADGFQSIDDVQYFFDENGYMATGWVSRGVKDYYFDEDGSYDPTMTRPMLALTFDDGPGEYTDRLLDCLEENGAHATFFMLGQLVTPDDFHDYTKTIQRMKEIGCELGNHSWDHTELTTLGPEGVAAQFNNTDNALIEACGQPSTVIRPPYGSYNDDTLSAGGKPFILWCIDSLDWSYMDAELDYQEIMVKTDLADGSIILMHDIHEPSVECAVRIIPELIERGYKLVTISEMAEAKNVSLQNAPYTDFWSVSLASGIVAGYQGGAATTISTADTYTGDGSETFSTYAANQGTYDSTSSDDDDSSEEEYYEESYEESYDEEDYSYEEDYEEG